MEIRHPVTEDKADAGFWFHGRNQKPRATRLGRTRVGPSRLKPAFALFRLQLQRRRIDAVAQSGRAGSVLEHVPEMAVALRAQHFGPDHAVADVTLLVDMALHRGLRKARPAAAGIELGVGFEQRLPAAGAGIGAGPLLVLVLAGERPLGRLLAQNRILHRRQFLAPLGFALLDLAGHRLGVGHDVSLIEISAFSREPIAGSREENTTNPLKSRQLVTFALLTSVGFSM